MRRYKNANELQGLLRTKISLASKVDLATQRRRPNWGETYQKKITYQTSQDDWYFLFKNGNENTIPLFP